MAPLPSQALKKNENNFKVMFRKGKALGEEGFTEKALKVLQDLQQKSPAGLLLSSWLRPYF